MRRLFLILGMALTLVSNNAVALEPMPIVAVGPGARIHGADVSRWQHPNGRSIDFRLHSRRSKAQYVERAKAMHIRRRNW